ncbi:MAG: hypothetical protein O3C21_01640 [Verrucomicrobia bacterium]|nr:hypothetical protein [Verrucomicrobiota bacterium]
MIINIVDVFPLERLLGLARHVDGDASNLEQAPILSFPAAPGPHEAPEGLTGPEAFCTLDVFENDNWVTAPQAALPGVFRLKELQKAIHQNSATSQLFHHW